MRAGSLHSSLRHLFTKLVIGALPGLVGCAGEVIGGGSPPGTGTSGGSGQPTIAECGVGDNAISGSIDGVPLQYTLPHIGQLGHSDLIVYGSEQGMQLLFTFSTEPAVNLLHTDAAFLAIPILPGPALPLSTHQGLWVCDETGPLLTLGGELDEIEPITLGALRSLGTCPGKPIDGHLTACDSGNGCKPWRFEGSIGGQAVLLDGDDDLGDERTFPGQGVLAPQSGLAPFVLMMPTSPADAPDPGALYCVGSITIDPGGNRVLGDLSRLGTCAEAPPIAGAIAACIGPPPI